MSLRNKVLLGIAGIVGMASIAGCQSLKQQHKHPDVNIQVCKEYSEKLTPQERERASQGFSIAQQRARKQGIELEPSNKPHCITLRYLDQSSYLKTDQKLSEQDRENMTYEEELGKVQSTAYGEGLKVLPNLVTSLGYAENDTANISIPQTTRHADNLNPQTDKMKEDLRQHYIAYVSLHEIGHSAGLLHPETVPNLSDEEKEILEEHSTMYPNLMSERRPQIGENSVDPNHAFNITPKQKNMMKEGTTPGTELYRAIRKPSIGLEQLLKWYKQNLDSEQSTAYVGLEENKKFLPVPTQNKINQLYQNK